LPGARTAVHRVEQHVIHEGKSEYERYTKADASIHRAGQLTHGPVQSINLVTPRHVDQAGFWGSKQSSYNTHERVNKYN